MLLGQPTCQDVCAVADDAVMQVAGTLSTASPSSMQTLTALVSLLACGATCLGPEDLQSALNDIVSWLDLADSPPDIDMVDQLRLTSPCLPLMQAGACGA